LRDVQLGDGCSHHRSELSLERRRQRLDDGHVEPEPATRRRHLEPDEACADHRDPRPPLELGADRHRVVERPQRMDAGEAFGARQGARGGAGGHDEPGVRNGVSVGQRDLSLVRVERHRADAEERFDAEERVVRLQRRTSRLPFSAQDLLREGRPIVG